MKKMIFVAIFAAGALSSAYLFFKKTEQSNRQISSNTLSFPENFKWCVATAAHQFEGQNDNSDWWEWENRLPSKIKNGDKSGIATDHWRRVEEDVALLKDLGVKQYRFSVEWSRIEPREGEFDLKAMEHYQDEIRKLKENGIIPMVTLHHFTSPLWFSKAGGWANSSSPQKFLQFTKFVNQHLGDEVEYWTTFNEPMVMIAAGYVTGVFPPGIMDWKQVTQPIKNILIAHSLAYKELHINPKALVGIAHHMRIIEAFHSYNPIENYMAHKLSEALNWTFMNAIKTGVFSLHVPTKVKYEEGIPNLKNTQDYIGVNYYTRDLVKFTPFKKDMVTLVFNEKNRATDLGWEIYPEGFYQILKSVNEKFNNLPIFITENGIADKSDELRPDYLSKHLSMLHKAISEGVNVMGYCHWTLMDNFEWAEGFSPRFGLYEVDYKTLDRIPRKSALQYQKIILENAILESP